MYNIDTHLLPLEGAKNARDLGGYPTQDGYITKSSVFIRSENTSRLTPHDIDFLKTNGLQLVVDLRSLGEVQEFPSAFENESDILYKSVPLLDGIHSASFFKSFPSSLGELYRNLLDTSQASFGQIFHAFSACEKSALFNCTAGKDRTGLVAMLLLDLVLVKEDAIIADYAATEMYLCELDRAQKQHQEQKGIVVPDYVLRSTPETMEETLAYLRKNYGCAKQYLLRCGVTDQELAILINRFVLI